MDFIGRLSSQLVVGGTVSLYSGTSQGAIATFSTNSHGLVISSCLRDPPRNPLVGDTRDEQVTNHGQIERQLVPNGKWKKRFMVFQATCKGWLVTIYRPKKEGGGGGGGSSSTPGSPRGSLDGTVASPSSPRDSDAASPSGAPLRSHLDNNKFMSLIESGKAEIKSRVFIGASAACFRVFPTGRSQAVFNVAEVDSLTGQSRIVAIDSFVTLQIPKIGTMEFYGRDAVHTERWVRRLQSVLELNQKIVVASKLLLATPVTNLQPNTFLVQTTQGSLFSAQLLAVTVICEFIFEIEGVLCGGTENQVRRWRLVFDKEPQILDGGAAVSIWAIPVPVVAPTPPNLKVSDAQKVQEWAKKRGSNAAHCDAAESVELYVLPPAALQTIEGAGAKFCARFHGWLRQLGTCTSTEEAESALAAQASFAFHKHSATLAYVAEVATNAAAAAVATDSPAMVADEDSAEPSSPLGPINLMAELDSAAAAVAAPPGRLTLPAHVEAELAGREAEDRMHIEALEAAARNAAVAFHRGGAAPPVLAAQPVATLVDAGIGHRVTQLLAVKDYRGVISLIQRHRHENAK